MPSARLCCSGLQTFQLGARSHDLLLKSQPANHFLASFYKIVCRVESGSVWNIHRDVCSCLAFSRKKTFLPPRLPPSPVFCRTTQTSHPCASFVKCGAWSWMQKRGEGRFVCCMLHWCCFFLCISMSCMQSLQLLGLISGGCQSARSSCRRGN